MTALALALRACSVGASALGAGAVAASVLAFDPVAPPPAALPPGAAAAATVAVSALAATVAATPLCLGAATDRARISLSRRRFDLIGAVLDGLRAAPAALVGALVTLSLHGPLGALRALCLGVAAMACVNLASYAALCEEALRAVPHGLEEASLALGATPWFTLRRVTWPAAARGILGAALRATARLLGEGVALVMVLGWRGGGGGGPSAALCAAALLCVLAARATSR